MLSEKCEDLRGTESQLFMKDIWMWNLGVTAIDSIACIVYRLSISNHYAKIFIKVAERNEEYKSNPFSSLVLWIVSVIKVCMRLRLKLNSTESPQLDLDWHQLVGTVQWDFLLDHRQLHTKVMIMRHFDTHNHAIDNNALLSVVDNIEKYGEFLFI